MFKDRVSSGLKKWRCRPVGLDGPKSREPKKVAADSKMEKNEDAGVAKIPKILFRFRSELNRYILNPTKIRSQLSAKIFFNKNLRTTIEL